MKYYNKKELGKIFVRFLFYILFIILLVNIAVRTESSWQKWFLIVFGVIALVVTGLSEYLKYLYNQALYALNFELNPEKAIVFFDKVDAHDIFKGYRKTRYVFDVQVSIEQNRAEDVLDIIEKQYDYFNSSVELKMIQYYYQLRAYCMLNRHNKLKATYENINRLRRLKKPPRIFSFDEIDGIYYLGMKDYRKAYRSFQKVDMKYMNPKECCFILKQLCLLSKDGKNQKYKKEYDELVGEIYESK